MKSTYSITQAQRQLPALLRQVGKGEAVSITRHDETVGVLLSRDHMDCLVETMEVLANPAAMAEIRKYEQGLVRFRSLDSLDEAER